MPYPSERVDLQQASSISDREAGTWLSLADDLLWGFNHALSNRLAAITSIAKILEYSDTGLDPLLAALSDEIVTLERTLDLLRLIPRNPDGAAEPVRLEDLLPDVLRLHRVRGELRDLDYDLTFEGEAQAILVEPARVNHAFLVAFGAVARYVTEAGGSRVEATVISTDARVDTRLEASVPAGASPDRASLCTPSELALMNHLVTPFGGEVSDRIVDDGGNRLVRIEIGLPTLRAVREAEAARR